MYGKRDGLMLRPKEGESPNTYLGALVGDHRSLLAKAMKNLDMDQERLMESERRLIEERAKATRQRVDKAVETRRVTALERGELPLELSIVESSKWKLALGTLGACIESYYTEPAFELSHYGGNNLTKIVAYFLLSGFFFGLGHLAAGLIRQTESTSNKWVIRGAAGIFFVGVFYGLGKMRLIYMQNLQMTTMQTVGVSSFLVLNPVYYVLLSLLLMSVSTWCALSLGTRGQKAATNHARDLDAKIASLDGQIEGWNNELDSYPDRLHGLEVRKARLEAEAESTRARVTSLFSSAVSAYQQSNLSYRTDGVRPSSFDEPISLDLLNQQKGQSI